MQVFGLSMKRRITWFATLLVMGPALLVFPSACTSYNGDSVKTSSKPVIEISYVGTFAGQVASGYLNLIIKATINNKGYELFKVVPEMLAVVVEGYHYEPIKSEIATLALNNGEMANGEFTFQVPPEAVSPRVGYQLAWVSPIQQNVECIRISEPSASESDIEIADPAIAITYSENYLWVQKDSALYLLVSMTIENLGYESFNTSPEYFSLVMGEIFGEPGIRPPVNFDGLISDQRDGSYSNMRSFDLQNGGKISGVLAFNVPTSILKSTESTMITYSGVRSYSIRWIKTPPVKMR